MLVTEPPVTVILPTHDHPTTLPHAIAAVLTQSFADFRLVVIGDGVGDDTRDVMAEVRRGDPRVSFLDRPKDVRHAEEARDRVIREVDSPIIAYVGDDDLALPWHLQEMVDLLSGHDFVHPLPIFVAPDGSMTHIPTDLSRTECLDWHRDPDARNNAVSLTGVVHTRDSYLRLPHGWRPAPPDVWTDLHMWRQYFALPGLLAATAARATTVKLASVTRQALPADVRSAEIRMWSQRCREPEFRKWWDGQVATAVRAAAVDREMALAAAHHEILQLQQQAESDRASADERLAQLATERDEVARELATVTNSRSWRLSESLRRVVGAIRPAR